ncbi:M1 family metallopeptidase, partial [Candidatus Bathyarchaeota archaeon]|nr:M1 family metallopeptidase [Candidatus Bathyarchaeota archaeon]
MAKSGIHHLASTVQPHHYDLTLTPDFHNFIFTARVSIDLEIAEATSVIVCNAANLNISTVTVQVEQNALVPVKSLKVDEASETLSIELGRALTPGHVRIQLEYSGTLNDELRGFYRIQYTGIDGKQRYMAATQFEATDARRAFPCWDEPTVKATFQVTLVIPSDLTAISNMPVEKETRVGPHSKAVRFTKTPRMSTYLLAFVIGDMSYVEAPAHDGTQMRVWATRGKETQGQLALECATKLLGFLSEYFNIAFPLPKLDHVALPEFASGAMENWGIITYRETALLYDPQNSAAPTHQRIVEIVAHEMAHMWFGNLVTMAWWDDLWLNESFASWMGDKVVDKLYPEWNMWTQFVAHDTNSGLSLDGLENSHPVHVQVKNPGEIREIFDAISYSKGASVLRMLEAFLGQDTFRQGLHKYLKDHQYGNATTGELWRALEEVSGQPVAEIMSLWIDQSGHPLLRVQSSHIHGKTRLTVEQHKFSYSYITGRKIKDASIWHVPVQVLRRGSATQVSKLITTRHASIELESTMTKDWIKLNAGQCGFYRVNYSLDDWAHLQQAVRNHELPTIDRLGLANDGYALQLSGILPATEYLSLVQTYKGEDDAIVWSELSSSINDMASLLRDESFL